MPANVTLEGRYGHISEIPLAEADAWLYTSGWDGVPSQLLEVAVTGVPIVGTLVGGTGEVLTTRTCRGRSREDAGPRRLRGGAPRGAGRPADARRRALALRERMLRERTEEASPTAWPTLLLTDGRESDR